MKYLLRFFLFASFLVLTACGSSKPNLPNPELLISEEQEFVLTPDSSGLEAAATARVPRLVVRLSIKSELDDSGQPTGQRYGQAAFFWTDISRSNGGSNLGGIVSIWLQDANTLNHTEVLGGSSAPIMSNVNLYNQTGYEDHIVKTSTISFKGPICLRVSGINLISTNGYRFSAATSFDENFQATFPMSLCQRVSGENFTDLSLTRLHDPMVTGHQGIPFILTTGIINSGTAPANDVTVNIDVDFPLGLDFVEDKSGLFDCSSQIMNNPYKMRITCHTSQLAIGLQSLPLIFKTNPDYQTWNFLYEVFTNISTANPESNLENNSNYSVFMID